VATKSTRLLYAAITMTVLYIVVGLSPVASCFSSEPSSVTERASDDQSPGYRDNTIFDAIQSSPE